ncbi:MAG: hypothetical protein IT557_09885 [Alphaproteobacteria bacterium]|nr:hypothetical protein [Alphaproteobacteria bacterium]
MPRTPAPPLPARFALELAHDGPIPAEALALAACGTPSAAARRLARRAAAEAEAAADAARRCLAALRRAAPRARLPASALSRHAQRLQAARDAAMLALAGARPSAAFSGACCFPGMACVRPIGAERNVP